MHINKDIQLNLTNTTCDTMSCPDLTTVRDALKAIALEAGELIREKTGKVAFDDKKNAVDLVTDIDKAVEDLVGTRLRTQFPSCEFMGEESYVAGETKLSDAPTFIVDPIDGTTNFIHQFPFSCISLGFAYKKQPVVGVVYNPHLKQMYVGVKGQGSFLNDERLPLRRPTELKLQSGLIAIEWGADRSGQNYKVKIDTFDSLAKEQKDGGAFAHGFRSLGSAAMNTCNVAAGLMDCYWEGGCYAWDVCAAWIILTEAGGRMVGGNRQVWDPSLDSRVYLAVRGGDSQTEFIEEFWTHVKGHLDYKS